MDYEAVEARLARPWAAPRLAALARGLMFVGCALALASAVGGYSPWKIGIWSDSAPIAVLLHFGSSLAAAGLLAALLAESAPVRAVLRHPFVLLPLALAAWGLVTAAFADHPLLAILGAPQTAEGALLFLDMAILVASGMMLRRQPALSAGLGGVALAVAVLLPLLAIAPALRIYFFNEWLAFYGLCLPVIVWVLLAGPLERFQAKWKPVRRPEKRQINSLERLSDSEKSETALAPRALMAMAVVAMLPALVISTNRTGVAASLLLGLPALLVVAWLDGRRQAERWLRRLVAGVAVVLPLVILALIVLAGRHGWVASLKSRELIDAVLLQQLWEGPRALLLGRGWGHSLFGFIVHLNASAVDLWTDGWDIPARDFFHSHHEGLEALLAGGVPGLLLMLALPAGLPLFCDRRRLALASAFALAYAGLSALWFQLPATVGFVALAFAALAAPVAPAEPVAAMPSPEKAAWRRGIAVPAAGLLAVILLAGASAGFLLWDGLAMARAAAPYLSPATHAPRAAIPRCAHFPRDDWRGGIGLGRVLVEQLGAAKRAVAVSGQPIDAGEAARLQAVGCAVDQAAARAPSLYLLVAGLNLRGDAALLGAFAAVRPSFGSLFDSWEPRLATFLALAPRRTDMAVPYFGWQLRSGHPEKVLRLADRILAGTPRDPVALWYSGSVLVDSPDRDEARHGLWRLRLALENGIEQRIPIDGTLKQKILSATASLR